MSNEKPFRLGVVEGFFGIPWSWEDRLSYGDFLADQGFNAYLYAPKSDKWLRRQWHAPFPDDHKARLRELSARYRDRNLDFGIGLSPFELYRDFGTGQRAMLRQKLEEINQIGASSLCLLFDDMPGDLHDLARRQGEIMAFVLDHSTAGQFMLCPTYYSDDPALARHFGKMPDGYLEDLGNAIAPEVDIFWTGPKVISREYPPRHLQVVAEKLLRKPLIWDNYPVNDAASLAPYLHLAPGYDNTAVLKTNSRGHMANPMNQAMLSQLPLYALAQSYRNPGAGDDWFHRACQHLCPPPLAAALLEDLPLLQETGLNTLSNEQKAVLKRKYTALGVHPMAREILDWLQGKYVFDPACLT